MDKAVDKFARIGLLVLATLRATRFVTSDWLGHWYLIQPARRWAIEETQVRGQWMHATPEDAEGLTTDDDRWERIDWTARQPWRLRLVKGLDCPFCVGFWIGGLILLVEWLTLIPGLRWARPLWTGFLATLALNEVVGHVSSRIDE